MQNKDWIKAGEDILHSVMDAVEHQDFSGLSRNIQSTVNDTLGNATQEWLREKRARDAARQQQYQRQESAAVQLYKKNPPGTYSGVTFQVLGIIGLSLFGIATFVLTIVGFVTGTMGVWLANMIASGFLAGSGVMLSCGLKLKRRVARFKNYVKQVGEKQYCRIEDLAAAVGKKTGFVKKELRKMIEEDYFLQGHLDHAGTTLITSNDMYEKYLQAEQSRKDRELMAAKQAVIREQNSAYPQQVQEIFEEGSFYIKHIHACNDAIPGDFFSCSNMRFIIFSNVSSF